MKALQGLKNLQTWLDKSVIESKDFTKNLQEKDINEIRVIFIYNEDSRVEFTYTVSKKTLRQLFEQAPIEKEITIED
jgi:hypothetical protein